MKFLLLVCALSASWLAACTTDVTVLTPLAYEPADASLADAGSESESDSGSAETDAGDAASTSAPPEHRLASAFAHSCVVRAGALYCWGSNAHSQVGSGGPNVEPRPVRIADQDIVDVCAGIQHSCALRSDGVALCWGANDHGQLGLEDMQPRTRPSEVPTYRFAAIGCGGYASCGIGMQGELFCWGVNDEGELGQADDPPPAANSVPDSPKPLRVESALSFRQVSLGEGHVCGVHQNGRLYCWGRNTEGQVGSYNSNVQVRGPALVDLTDVARVAAGQRHTCAIDRAGKLYCWGDYLNRKLESDWDGALVRSPTAFGDGNAFYDDVSVNWFHSCVHERRGSLSCWGRNEEGQLGLGDTDARTLPSEVGMPTWHAFAAGQFHTCGFLGSDVYCWGADDTSQLGIGSQERRNRPALVSLP